MMGLLESVPLLDPPSATWEPIWDKLMRGNNWLARKVDRARRLREHEAYLHEYLPELTDRDNPGAVIDIGPGPGEFLELCRALGHEIFGIDSPNGKGGMGSEYVEASRMMTTRQKIPVAYIGLDRWLASPLNSHLRWTVAAINSRGSIEQSLARHMDGDHELHHDSKRLAWKISAELRETFQTIFEQSTRLLRSGGAIMIYSNGSSNSRCYDRLVCEEAAKVGGLELVRHESPQIHKWRKVS